MATRVSGRLEINLKFLSANKQYQARLCARPKMRGMRCALIHVGHPPGSAHAPQTPEAYDSAARAAISFAPEELQELADMGPNSWDLQRLKRTR